MNTLIKPFTFVTNDEILQSIKSLTDQLVTNNYAIVSNPSAVQLFSRKIPQYYRERNIIIFVSKRGKNMIVIDPAYKFNEVRTKIFRITPK